jgi:hypothetical protein
VANAYKVSVADPVGKKPRGRPGRSCEVRHVPMSLVHSVAASVQESISQ